MAQYAPQTQERWRTPPSTPGPNTNRKGITPPTQEIPKLTRANQEALKEMRTNNTAELSPEPPPPEPEPHWCPVMTNNWKGSNFDKAPPRTGCIRMATINARTMSFSAQGKNDQHTMWARLTQIGVTAITIADTALLNPTVKEPYSSLYTATQTLKVAWTQPHATISHAQGAPGIQREAVGGTMTAYADNLKPILGPQIDDPRGWGRWTGRTLIGTNKIRMFHVGLYFPAEPWGADTNPGSAWNTQKQLMQQIPEEERQANPWAQAIYDLTITLMKHIHTTKSQETMDATLIVVNGDFNARWNKHTAQGTSSEIRTELLREFAATFYLEEAFQTIHPTIEPYTYTQSTKPGAKRSWIDFTLVTSTLNQDGFMTEAGIMTEEVLLNSDHRLYVVEIDITNALRLGPTWHNTTRKDRKNPPIKLTDKKQIEAFQNTLAKRWTKLKVETRLQQAETAIDEWNQGRDRELDGQGLTDWGTADPHVIQCLDTATEAAINSFVGAWRTVSGRLPTNRMTGGKRKDLWSRQYETNVREFRTLTEIGTLWAKHKNKQGILNRLMLSPTLMPQLEPIPEIESHHTQWVYWIRRTTAMATLKRKELHGSWRAQQQKQMMGFVKWRSKQYESGSQKMAIASWLKRAKRPPPIASIAVDTGQGTHEIVVEPIKLISALEEAFLKRSSGGYGPSRWYEGHPLASPAPEGWEMRRAMARGEFDRVDWKGIPPHIHYAIKGAEWKHITALNGPLTPKIYEDRGCMGPITHQKWQHHYATKKKGTAPGQSQLTSGLIWASAIRIEQKQTEGQPTVPKRSNTPHCFKGLNRIANMVIETGMIPSVLLRNLMCLIDKELGKHGLGNKRPLTLVEELLQAILGSQYKIVEEVWHDYSAIDDCQAGGAKTLGTDIPIMSVKMKAEHAWLNRTALFVTMIDQSKAFETLTPHIGQEMALRRFGVPEKLLILQMNVKRSTHVMITTKWGPKQADWDALTSRITRGINTLLKPDSPTWGRQAGYHDINGTFQGATQSGTIYRAYGDWGSSLVKRYAPDPAPLQAPNNRTQESHSNTYIDDQAGTSTTEKGTVAIIQVNQDFFEVHDGKFNPDKTLVLIMEFTKAGVLKLQREPGTQYDPEIHIPDYIEIPSGAARHKLNQLQKRRAALPTDDTTLDEEIAKTQGTLLNKIPVKGPYHNVTYLGAGIQLAGFPDNNLDKAKQKADALAASLTATAATHKEANELVRIIAKSQIGYLLKCDVSGPTQIDKIEPKLRTALKNKMSFPASFPNKAFAGTLHESISNGVLIERISMLMRLIQIGHPISAAFKGAIERLQRWTGSGTPILQHPTPNDFEWEGTWMGTLANWLGNTNITIAGATAPPLLTDNDAFLVDLATPQQKSMVARGCRNHKVWRISELTDMNDEIHPDSEQDQPWDMDSEWCDNVQAIWHQWKSEHPEPKQAQQWNPEAVLEHKVLAMIPENPQEPIKIGVPTELILDPKTGYSVKIKWMQPHLRSEIKHRLNSKEINWLQERGGIPPTEQQEENKRRTPNTRSKSTEVRDQIDSGPNDAQSYIWTIQQPPQHQIIPITELSPITITTCTQKQNSRRLKITTVAERQSWQKPNWTLPKITQEMPYQHITNVLYHRENPTREPTNRKDRWKEQIRQANEKTVLLVASDCAMTQGNQPKKLSYGYLSAGIIPNRHVKEGQDGTWTVDSIELEKDHSFLQKGMWGGGVVSGPQQDLTTFRGESVGMLATMKALREEEWPGRIYHVYDNLASVNRVNKTPAPLPHPAATAAPEDTADPDVMAAIRQEQRKWGTRYQVKWQRAHAETRKHRSAWNTLEVANDWADAEADCAMKTFTATQERTEYSKMDQPGDWAIQIDGIPILNQPRKAMKAALKADSFYEYLKQDRRWSSQHLAAFSKPRWISRLTQMNNAANATVLVKMITGWLATKSKILQRDAKVNEELTKEQLHALGKCRLCDTETETSWHVHARCTHPLIVAERRAAIKEIEDTVSRLTLNGPTEELLKAAWMLDPQGRIPELDTTEQLVNELNGWAPELQLKADHIKQTMIWVTSQGEKDARQTDNSRHTQVTGLLSNHWQTLITSMGATSAEAHHALVRVEKAVTNSLPSIWNVFTTELHRLKHPDHNPPDINERVDKLFDDWATDQGPMYITRGEVKGMIHREKKRWIAKKSKQLTKRRRVQISGAAQPQITAFFDRIPTAKRNTHHPTTTTRQGIRQTWGRKRKKKTIQPVLVDYKNFDYRPRRRMDPSTRPVVRRLGPQMEAEMTHSNACGSQRTPPVTKKKYKHIGHNTPPPTDNPTEPQQTTHITQRYEGDPYEDNTTRDNSLINGSLDTG